MRTRIAILLVALVTVSIGCSSGSSSGTKASATLGSKTTVKTATIVRTPTPASPPATLASNPTTAPSAAAGVHCGTERWPVKTLSDSDAGLVNFAPVAASVSQLRSLSKPASLPDASRIGPTELTDFTVTAELVEFKQEDDRDIHLVISDPTDPSHTMIVEFPDALDCSGAVSSAHAQEMRDARAAFVAAFGLPPTSQFTHISGTATLTGVGFFDFLHGQTGVAPNGIELHPVLSFSVLGSSAPPPPPPVQAAPTSAPVEAGAYPCEADASCNCPNFPTHAEAQRVFDLHGGSPSYNWAGLDHDHDGIACEALP